ncbi:MAG TPA: hypothetical protein VL989_01990 [Candidatus Sulfotelmatobacter sp.]|nr:hypothetical protein [Candidatus Sulfotelmatobacter sp.]
MEKATDSKVFFIKFAKLIAYLAYLYFLVATVFLVIGFFLLLFGANQNVGFVKFVYHFAAVFLQPFRGIFPTHQLTDRSYFSASALFAIIMYGIGAVLINSLVTWLSYRQAKYQEALNKIS